MCPRFPCYFCATGAFLLQFPIYPFISTRETTSPSPPHSKGETDEMDKVPYYIAGAVCLVIGLLVMIDPKGFLWKWSSKIDRWYYEIDRGYKRMVGDWSPKNPPEGYRLYFRILGGVIFIISLIVLLGLLTGHI